MLERDKAVLVVVDVQGKLATLMYQKEEFYKNVVRMIEGCKLLDIPVIWNEQLPDKLGQTIPEIKEAMPGLSPLVKNTFSCCGNPEFMKKLEETEKTQVILVGMETHVCVYQTALDLIEDDYEVYLAADAVSSRSIENKQVGIEAMRDLGAGITSVEMAFFEMLRVAEGEEFKKIINIVK